MSSSIFLKNSIFEALFTSSTKSSCINMMLMIMQKSTALSSSSELSTKFIFNLFLSYSDYDAKSSESVSFSLSLFLI